MRKRQHQAGFSVLELLIIGGVIAVLCAIAIYNYMNALNRAKQKRTVNDIRIIAQAWEARAADTNTYAVAGFTFPTTTVTHAQLTAALRPTYLRDIPALDGWMRAIQFGYSPAGTPGTPGGYGIRSAGRDGLFQSSYESGATTDSDCDIVWANGSFVAYPDVIQGD
jgi:type II secretory pathway pseudopilin PulG